MDENIRIVEVGGVKLEIDLRHANVIEKFRVGDGVKILVKKYADNYESYPGAIIGFDNFKERPTIIVAYVEAGYSTAEVKMAYINKDTADTELVPACEGDFLQIEKSRIEDMLDQQILKAEQSAEDAKAKKAYFLKYFGRLFEATG